MLAVTFLALSGRGWGQLTPGLRAEIRSEHGVDFQLAERPALFVAAGSMPSPTLPPEAFSVTWEGFISSDLRSDYLFRFEFTGKVELNLNGRSVLAGEGSDQVALTAKPVRLNKGTNSIAVRFMSSGKADSYVRLFWGEKEFLLQPIPPSVLTHAVSAEQSKGLAFHRGRDLFADLRCLRCHHDSPLASAMAEATAEAPSLDGIGTRRSVEWMQRWIANPAGMRPHARMPRLFAGSDADEPSRAIAAYLSTLTLATKDTAAPTTPLPTPPAATPAADAPALPPLYERLQCAACHSLQPDSGATGDLVSLAEVSQKFPAGELERYLLKPEAHDRWSRMPNFHLTQAEATELAAFLRGKGKASEAVPPASKPEWVTRGRELVMSSGCLNCHVLPLANQAAAPGLDSLRKKDWNRGCLGTNAAIRGKAPEFALTASDRQALREFGRSDLSSLSRDSATDFAKRQASHLRCTACHGPVAGIPAFELLGGKLKPEWAASFIAGDIPYKPRADRHPKGEIWMPARMPAFPAYAAGLAQGLAMSHGVPAQTPSEPKPDPELAQLGRKLLGKEGGFSCVSCHAVGKVPALEVFESEGINLAYSGRRLQRRYFDRWMRAPILIDPQTKMPAYFDEEGQSQLSEVLEGQAVKQIDAIWHYLQQGDAMVPPVLPANAP